MCEALLSVSGAIYETRPVGPFGSGYTGVRSSVAESGMRRVVQTGNTIIKLNDVSTVICKRELMSLDFWVSGVGRLVWEATED